MVYTPVSSVGSRKKAKRRHPYKMEEGVLSVEAISRTTPGMCVISRKGKSGNFLSS